MSHTPSSNLLAALIGCLSIATFATNGHAAEQPTVAEIAAASVAASGGAALEAVESVERNGRIHLESDIFGVLDGTWTMAGDPKLESVTRLADETLDDTTYYVLGHTGELGEDVRIYVDPATFLIRRCASSISSRQLGTSAATIDLPDYAEHDGVQLPRKTVQVIENLWRTEMSYDETEIGGEIADDLFTPPAS